MKSFIRLRPVLQEFVICAFLQGTKKVTAADTLGKLIKPWLSRPPKNYDPLIPEGENFFVFELPVYNDKNTQYNFYLSPRAQHYISVILNEMFLAQMFVHLDKVLIHLNRESIKDAIYDYCYSYNISFHNINYDSLKKSYYRHRKKTKKTRHDLSLTCPFKLVTQRLNPVSIQPTAIRHTNTAQSLSTTHLLLDK